MRKIIVIAESVLDTVFRDSQPVRAFVGGRIANAAATLGALGHNVAMVSECGTDRVGDIIVDFLERHGVNTKSVDRYPDGTTPFSAIFSAPDTNSRDAIVNYGSYPDDRFNVVWPRIDENDIIVFGSLYSIDQPQRERLFELVNYAVERKAIIVYLPGFQHGINFRITKVMPAILENLEVADVVIAHERDINDIFPRESAEEAYHNHIEFYSPNYLHISPDLSITAFTQAYQKSIPTDAPAGTDLLGWQAGLTAGIVDQILKRDLTRDDLQAMTADAWGEIVTEAYRLAERCAAEPEHSLPAE